MATINHYRKFLTGKLDLDLPIEKCEGNKIYTKDGRVIRDYLSQYGALPFGHNPDFCKKAVIDHLENNGPVFTQPIFQEETEAFADELVEALGGWATHVTFTNSGAETVEAGFKLARTKSGRKKILSVDRSFHGKTYSALLATNSRRHNIDHLVDKENFHKITLNDFDALELELKKQDYAAFIVEPIQGEGGMHVADPQWIARARELCSKTRTILIFDEIQTGLGRTGGMCSAMDIGVTPDIMLLAKSLSGGLIPTGAALYTKSVNSPEFDRKHSSTFANNGLATTVGRAVIRKLRENDGAVLDHVKSISKVVDECCDQLVEKYPSIFSWRGAGLMRSIQFRDETADGNYFITFLQNSGSLAWLFCSHLLNHHQMLVMPLLSDKCSIRFEPPLNTSEEDIRDFFEAVDNVCRIVKNGRYDILFASLIDKPHADLPKVDVSFPVLYADQIAPIKYEDTDKRKGKTFAFLIHFTVVDDLVRMLPQSVHANFTPKECTRLGELFLEVGAIDFSPEVALRFGVSDERSYANGMMILAPMSPRAMMDLTSAEKVNLMKDYFNVAEREGVELVGLGAYTSVVTNGGTKNIEGAIGDMSLTTGNSLTAMSTTESVLEASGRNLIGSTVTVIGARGAVGKLMVSEFSHWCDDIILIGRPGTEQRLLNELLPILCRLAFDLKQEVQVGSVIHRIQEYVTTSQPELATHLTATNPVEEDVIADLVDKIINSGRVDSLGLRTSDSYEKSLGESDYVVSATSEGKPFLSTELLKEGAIAVDTARPFDFIVKPGQKAQVLEGGLVVQPKALRYGDCNMVGLPPGVNLACLSETIALSMADCEGRFSIGRSIKYSQARDIIDVARNQGFRPLGYPTATKNSRRVETETEEMKETELA